MNRAAMGRLFGCISRGVYVVGVCEGDRCNAFTAASVNQLSYTPLLLGIAVNPSHVSYAMMERAGQFSVNVLHSDQLDLAMRFGRKAADAENPLESILWQPGAGGAPLLNDAMAYFECRTVSLHEAGDHRWFIARVINGEVRDAHANPLLYRDTGNMDGAQALFPDHF